MGIDGLTHLQESPPIIELNTEITFEARRRFTLAHEIGHICIPWHSGITVCSLDDPSYKVQGQTLINTQELGSKYICIRIVNAHSLDTI